MKNLAEISNLPDFREAELPAPLKYLDGRLQWAIQECACRVSQSSILNAEALILTGSVARGEVTALVTDNGLYCLSDMEFLVAVRDRSNWKRRAGEISNISQGLEKQAAERGLTCTFEFTPALERYFRNVRPSIFGYELRCHGKTLWGDHAYHQAIPAFTADEIPKLDAFYLICNRMVEQLDWWARLQQTQQGDATKGFAYSLVKTYIDLATSLLVFVGDYAPTYASRSERLDSLKPVLVNDLQDYEVLVDRISTSTAMKLNPTSDLLEPLSKTESLHRWQQLAHSMMDVWQWELQTLQETKNTASESIRECFVRGATLSDQLREWARFARNAIRRRPRDLFRARWLRGVPRHMLYVEAADLYADCANISRESDPTQRSMPLRPRASVTIEERIAELLDVWRSYFRNQ